MFVLDNASSSHTQSPCPCLSASASMPHARGETHASATRADLPSPKRPGSVDGAGPALFIPDQDIRACLSVARSAWVHRPARVEESRWSRAPSDFRGSSLRLAARRADPQDRTPFVCGRRFPAPRIARTEEIARGGDGEGPLRVVDRFFGKLSPRDSRGLRASVPLSRALPTERVCPRFVFCLPRNFTVFAPRTHMDVSQAGLGPHERRGLPHPGVRGERAEILQTPVPPDGSACPLRGTKRGTKRGNKLDVRWHDFPLGGKAENRNRDCQAFFFCLCPFSRGARRRRRRRRVDCFGKMAPVPAG